MNSPHGNVALITGATSGIGRATAQLLAKEGFRVYGGSRHADGREEFPGGGFIQMLMLDVTDEKSVSSAVEQVMQSEGHVDILLNAAGIGIAGAVEDCTAEDAYRQMNTNYLGVVRMLNAVLPIMRAQKRGIVVNIGSVGGIYSIPFQTLYSSSKFAVEALTEGLRMELTGTGVKAALVEPGDVKTGFTAARIYAPRCKNSDYMDPMGRAVGQMIRDETNGMPPEDVARLIAKIIAAKNPPVRRITKFPYQVMVFLKRLLPAALVEKVLTMMYVKAKEPSPDIWPPKSFAD